MMDAAIISAKAEVYLELMQFVSEKVTDKVPADEILLAITDMVKERAISLMKELPANEN